MATWSSPRASCSLARLDDEPVGCGALHFFPDGVADVKRMWVVAGRSGPGPRPSTARELEAQARAPRRANALRLETNRALVEAIGMYHAAGFVEVDAFNDEAHAHHWFAKPLTP